MNRPHHSHGEALWVIVRLHSGREHSGTIPNDLPLLSSLAGSAAISITRDNGGEHKFARADVAEFFVIGVICAARTFERFRRKR